MKETEAFKKIFLNRELSFLKFNKRVLEEADDDSVPLFEKFKFISIFHSNLDEFYMIRVGSLYEQSILNEGGLVDDKTGWSPVKQLREIFAVTKRLYSQASNTFLTVTNLMREQKINLHTSNDFKMFNDREKKWLKNYFKREILPLLSPQIIDTKHPFPHLFNKEIYIVLELTPKKSKEKESDKAEKTGKSGKISYGIVMLNKMIDRIITLPMDLTGGEYKYILAEDLLYHYVKDVFSNYKIISKSKIRITRNADITVEDSFADYDTDIDYRTYMKDILKNRGKLAPVRIEISASGKISNNLKKYLCSKFNIEPDQLFELKTPLDFGFVFSLQDKLLKAQLLNNSLIYPPLNPIYPPKLKAASSIINSVKDGDVFLSYPRDSMRAYIDLLHEALHDENVVSVKITLYRLNSNSQVIDLLCRMSENDKDVTAVVELRARFDEENNINWSAKLEEAGCNIIYGIDDYKIHSKVTLITSKTETGISYITHLATGNYNEKTAKLYTDVGIITADENIGKDAVNFFHSITTSNISPDNDYSMLLVAPYRFKSEIIKLIKEEASKASAGKSGYIGMKMNSLTDKDIICELAKASQSGVKIDLVIRGICCLLPGIENFTANINIISVVGRFLEHSRIFIFGEGTGKEKKIYISSADLMTRNTTRRVEVAAPILDEKIKTEIETIFTNLLKDTAKSRRLCSNSNYEKILSLNDDTPFDSQAALLLPGTDI